MEMHILCEVHVFGHHSLDQSPTSGCLLPSVYRLVTGGITTKPVHLFAIARRGTTRAAVIRDLAQKLRKHSQMPNLHF